MSGEITANYSSNQYSYLKNKLKDVEDKQGVFGSIWNGVKELTNLGTNESKCESKLEDYKNGKISFEDAVKYIDDFEQKQKNATNLVTNIATGAAAIAVTGATGGSALLAGGLTGAATKTAINIFDRATNKVEGDEFDTKQIIKDAATGSITGWASAVSSSKFSKLSNALNAKGTAANILNGVECGVTCGAISGAASNLIDVTTGDREFNVGELLGETATSAFVSGTVGGALGGATNIFTTNGSSSLGQQIAKTATYKVMSQGERSIIES